jgi:Putative adhesin
MRSRSLAAPLLLVILGALFLWRNLHPEAPIFDLLATWWPFLLIGWGLLRLMEVLIWRASREAALGAGEILLVVLICVAGMGLFEIHRHGIRLTPEIFGEQFEFPVEAGAPAGGAKRIVFENPRGTIHLNGADTQEIRINGRKLIRAYKREDAERTDGQTPVDIVPQGDRVLVTSHQERAPADERVSDELDITVPRGMAVEAYGGSADYEITDINGGVALGGSRGDVRIARIRGNVRMEIGRSDTIAADTIQGDLNIEGRGSDIDIQNVTGHVTVNGAYVGSLAFKNVAMGLHLAAPRMEVQAAAVPGSINMDLGDFSGTNLVGPVRLVTQSRDVHLAGFTDSLNLESVRGDVELQPGRVPLPRIDAHSGSGAIELLLPEKAEFQLQATAEHGDAVNDFGAPIETQVEGRAAVLKGAQGNGPLIRIIADRGSIAVRKEGSARGVEAPTSPIAPVPPVPPKAPASVNLKDSEVKL